MVLGVLGGLALGGLFVGYRYWAANQVASPVVVSPTPAVVAPEATLAAPPAAAAAVAGPSDVVFASASADTKSITAECGAQSSTGAAEVVVTGPVSGPCRVRLVKKDRSRLMADVAAPTAGKYTCFTADAKSCTK
ncbi:hypothetical protein LBMAG42_44050 [Deltaproteobacteria bacterium]|nr:hypothetical protein LBMAG42_44050 [Deltaproteobacteria bacterium]